MTNTFRIFYSSVPFKEPEVHLFDEGKNIQQIVEEMNLASKNIVVSVNGKTIDKSDWVKTEPKQKDVVILANTPEGAIAVAIIASVIVGLVVGYVLYKNMPDPNTDDVDQSTLSSLTGIQNRQRRYEPLSLILGKRTIAPAYAATPYTEIIGEDEYFNILLCAGYGPLKIEDVKIGDTPITSFPSSEYKMAILDHYQRKDVNAIRSLWPNAVVQSGLDFTLRKEGNYRTFQHSTATVPGVGSEYTETSSDFFFPRGIYRINNDGDYKWWWVGVKQQIKVNNKWYTVAKVHDIPVNSSNTDYMFKQVAGRLMRTTDNKLYVRGLETDPNILYSVDQSLLSWSSVTDDIVFIENIPFQTRTEIIASFVMGGNSPRQRRYSLRYRLPEGFDGQVRTAKMFPNDDLNSTKVGDEVQWTNIRSIKEESLQSFKDALYLNDPVVKPVIIALRIKATDNFNSMIDTLNVKATQVVPSNWNADWSNWASLALTPTENPADAYRWLLQGPAQVSRLPNHRLALDNLLEWRNFCNNQSPMPNYRISAELNTSETLLKALSTVATTGRAEFGFVDGKYGVVIKENKPYPVQIFTPKNSSGFTSARTFPEITDGVKIEFENELSDYQKDEVVYFDSRVSPEKRVGKFSGISFNDVPSAELATRHGRFDLFEKALRREVYKLTTDAEGLIAKRGDKVLIQNDVIDVGLGAGRILYISPDRKTFIVDEYINLDNVVRTTLDSDILLDSLVKLDSEEFSNDVGKTYGVIFRSNNGDISEVIRNSYMGDNIWKIIDFEVPASVMVGDFITYGEVGNEVLECVVDSIQYKDNYECDITLLNFAEEIYTYDGDTIPPFETGLNTRPEFVIPNAPVLDSNYSFRPSTSEMMIRVAYDFTYDFTIRSVGLFARDVSGSETFDELFDNDSVGWYVVDNIIEGDREFIVPNVVRGRNYQFKSRVTTVDSKVSPYSNIIETGYIPLDFPPSDVTGVSFSVVDRKSIRLSWLRVRDPDFFNYEIRKVVGNDEIVVGTTTSEFFDIGANIGEYRVYAQTVYNSYSTNGASVDVSFPTLNQVSTLSFQVNYGSVTLDWEEPNDTVFDIAYYEIRKVEPSKPETWEDATRIGRVAGSFALVSENISGTFVYMVRAYDIAGRESEISSVRVNVDRAGDFVLLTDDFINLEENGTLVGSTLTSIDGHVGIFAPVVKNRTFQQRIDRISIEDTSGIVPPSEVTTQNKVNAGWEKYTQPTQIVINDFNNPSSNLPESYYEKVIDLFDGYIETDPSSLIGGTRVSFTIEYQDITEGVTPRVFLAASADNIVWDEALEGTEEFFKDFRYIRLRIFFDAPLTDRKSQIFVKSIRIKLDVQKKTEEGVVLIDTDPVSGETLVQLTREFIDVESIVATVEGSDSSNFYAVAIFEDIPNPNEFAVKVYDSNGAIVTSTSHPTTKVSYIVRGI